MHDGESEGKELHGGENEGKEISEGKGKPMSRGQRSSCRMLAGVVGRAVDSVWAASKSGPAPRL